MNEEEIKYVKTENGYKITVPLLTDDELQKIDFNFNSIVDEYIKEFSNKREKTIEQRLIYDLQQEIDYFKKEYYNLLEKNGKTITNMSNIIDINKKRINKAIEYIDNHISYECDGVISGMRFCSHHLIDDFRKEDLLEILKGDSK